MCLVAWISDFFRQPETHPSAGQGVCPKKYAVYDRHLSVRGLSRWKLGCGVLAAIVGIVACNPASSSDSGALVIPYGFGKARDCTSMGVESVRAELNTGNTVEGSCKRGRVRFDTLDPGSYTVVMYGLDHEGVAVVDSLGTGPVKVEVVGGHAMVVVDPPIELVASPARLKLRWTFGFGSCESDSIMGFTVTAWHVDGSTELGTTNLACSTPGDRPDRYRLLPDHDRRLGGDVLAAVDVQPYDESNLGVGDHVSFGFAPPGAGGEIRLSLSCDEGGCRGSGVPDPMLPVLGAPAAMPAPGAPQP
jgi:hypothetical protein